MIGPLNNYATLRDRNAAIISFAREGRRIVLLSSQFGLSRNQVYNILHAAGMEMKRDRRWQTDIALVKYKNILSQIALSHHDGATIPQLITCFGFSEWEIKQALKIGGLSRGQGGWQRGKLSEKTKRILDLSKLGLGPTEIAAEVGSTVGSVGVTRWRYSITKQKFPRRLENWPYVSNWKDVGNGGDLIERVNALVPKNLPDHVRSDVCQETILRFLEGEIELTANGVRSVISKFYQLHPFRFAPISLDEPRRDGRSWHDVLSSDSFRVA